MKKLDAVTLQKVVSGLTPGAEGLFYFLPECCWMSERTMANALKTNIRVIRDAKKELEEAGLITIRRSPGNFQRVSEIHVIVKVESETSLLIPEEYVWTLRARKRVLSPLVPINEARDESVQPENVPMNWNLLKRYSPTAINRMTKLEQVRLYMDVGFIVLPTHYPVQEKSGDVICSCRKRDTCYNVGKHPAVNGYRTLTHKDYPSKREYFIERFRRNPEFNIGFKVSGFSVVDVDIPHGGGYVLEALREQFGGLENTLTVRSPNGIHLYSSTRGLRQSSSAIGDGIDVRSDMTVGFIVAPGSRHKSGRSYLWDKVDDLEEIPSEWLYDFESSRGRSKRKGKKQRDIKIPSRVDADYVIPIRERNDTLYKWACRFRGQGADEAHIYGELEALRDTFCEPSENSKDNISDAELRGIAKSAAKLPTNAEKLSRKPA